MENQELNRLIEIGEKFIFSQNSYQSDHGTYYTRASDDLLSWIASIESYVLDNYGKESGPYKLFEKFDQKKLNGYEERDFLRQKSILMGSIKSCKTVPKKLGVIAENPIIELLKNKTFWTVLVILIGASFALGIHFGNSKFDKEKLDLYEENRKLRNENIKLKESLNKKTVTITKDNIEK